MTLRHLATAAITAMVAACGGAAPSRCDAQFDDCMARAAEIDGRAPCLDGTGRLVRWTSDRADNECQAVSWCAHADHVCQGRASSSFDLEEVDCEDSEFAKHPACRTP